MRDHVCTEEAIVSYASLPILERIYCSGKVFVSLLGAVHGCIVSRVSELK